MKKQAMNYEPAEYYRLCADVPNEEELSLADEMREEFEWEDEVAELDREEQR